MKRYITGEQIGRVMEQMEEAGYAIYTVAEGVLGWGHIIGIAPGAPYCNVEIREEALNCWSSTHSFRKFHGISKRVAALIGKPRLMRAGR